LSDGGTRAQSSGPVGEEHEAPLIFAGVEFGLAGVRAKIIAPGVIRTPGSQDTRDTRDTQGTQGTDDQPADATNALMQRTPAAVASRQSRSRLPPGVAG